MSEIEDEAGLSPDELAFRADLKTYYNNPEVILDSSLPQFYAFFVRTTHLPNVPYILDTVVNGVDLPEYMRKVMIAMIKQFAPASADFDESEIHAELIADEEFKEVERDMLRFFIRHLPKLIIGISNITAVMSVVSVTGPLMDKPSEKEQFYRKMLKELLRELGRDIKLMLGTRTKGRPRKIHKSDRLPDIVKTVIDLACERMGQATGDDAVPGLKQIADALDLSPAALGKQLKRAQYPWLSSIKPYLASLPADKNPQ